MYFFNMLEPRLICDKAIKVLQQEQTKLSIEIGKLKLENSIENNLKISEYSQLYFEYSKLIDSLQYLGEFGVQQMESLAKNGKRKGKCIF